jgi:hypothetical protein
MITEIPVLADDQGQVDKEKAHDIFFYDIPKYWKEEDIVRELSKIGKVHRVQIRDWNQFNQKSNLENQLKI